MTLNYVYVEQLGLMVELIIKNVCKVKIQKNYILMEYQNINKK